SGLSAGGAAAPAAATEIAPVNAWGGDEDGGGDACSSASAGAPAIAAHSSMGTARRAFLDPRFVRVFPLLQNAGAARPRLGVEAHPATSENAGEARRPLLWIANWANWTQRAPLPGRRPERCFPRSRPRQPALKLLLRQRQS